VIATVLTTQVRPSASRSTPFSPFDMACPGLCGRGIHLRDPLLTLALF
jgi:hypothetical protein